MGHVSTRTFSLLREGPDLPRRQHRRSRPARNPPLARGPTGEVGERLACLFLIRHGLSIAARNVRVGAGEVDILARDHTNPLVVEVRTLTGSHHPLDAIDAPKRAQVRRLAQVLGIARCDFIGVGIHDDHYVVHWDQNAF